MKKRSDRREKVAELCHDVWAHWTEYFVNNVVDVDGTSIAQDNLCRWSRQIELNFEDLSEEEKESDRRIADRYLDLFDVMWESERKADSLKDLLCSIYGNLLTLQLNDSWEMMTDEERDALIEPWRGDIDEDCSIINIFMERARDEGRAETIDQFKRVDALDVEDDIIDQIVDAEIEIINGGKAPSNDSQEDHEEDSTIDHDGRGTNGGVSYR